MTNRFNPNFQENHGLRGSHQHRGSLTYYLTKIKQKQHSKLGCHHKKGGECKHKLLNQMVLMKTTWISNYQERMRKKIQRTFNPSLNIASSLLKQLLKTFGVKV